MGNHDPHAHEAEWKVAELVTFLFLIRKPWKQQANGARVPGSWSGRWLQQQMTTAGDNPGPEVLDFLT